MTRAELVLELERRERARAFAEVIRRYREHNDRTQARLAAVPPRLLAPGGEP